VNRYLIIRFSSFGDIMQALPVAERIRQNDSTAEIHWLTRQDFSNVLKKHRALDGVWPLARKDGVRGLWRIARELSDEEFTHVYDAHSNVRSTVICWVLRVLSLVRLKKSFYLIRRSKNRFKRFLLFRFRRNLFPQPFRGAESYLTPLKAWFKDVSLPTGTLLNFDSDPLVLPEDIRHSKVIDFENAITLAPGAAWELKRWPDEHWLELITKTPSQAFILLGGSEDEALCKKIYEKAPERIVNLAGRLSWLQSLIVLQLTRGLVAADTGLMHAADIMGKPLIALLGPTAFGHPSRETSLTLDVPLSCRPCTKDGRGRCTNSQYKRCMIEISPAKVVEHLNRLTGLNHF
jgi:ADP-heptose:LPS heptosyltransferase